MRCRHCYKRRASQARGLCSSCYFDRAIRERYPQKERGQPWADPLEPDEEPTQEKLERIIREQQQRLPSWWPQNGEVDNDE